MSNGRVAAAMGIYGGLGAIAWAGAASVGASPFHLAHVVGGTRWISLPVALVSGLVMGFAGTQATRWLGRSSRWGRAMTHELRDALLGTSIETATPMALASAVGEEMLFRGGIQAGLSAAISPFAGVVMASLLFGAMHVPWNRRLWSWTAMATVMGVVFGGLYLATGELLAPVIAHAVINRENLRYLIATRVPPAMGKPSTLETLPRSRPGTALGSR